MRAARLLGRSSHPATAPEGTPEFALIGCGYLGEPCKRRPLAVHRALVLVIHRSSQGCFASGTRPNRAMVTPVAVHWRPVGTGRGQGRRERANGPSP